MLQQEINIETPTTGQQTRRRTVENKFVFELFSLTFAQIFAAVCKITHTYHYVYITSSGGHIPSGLSSKRE